MRIEQLQYFLEIVQTGSITAAAENLFISQQSLCTSINRLEKELGLKLFNRTKRGTTLTADGKILSVYIADILEKYDVFDQVLAQRQQKAQPQLTGSVTLCTTPLLSAAILSDLIELIHQHFPRIQLNFVELSIEKIFQYVLVNPSSLGLILSNQHNAVIMLSNHDTKINLQLLLRDHMVACVSSMSQISLKDIFSADDFATAKRINFILGPAQSENVPADPKDVFLSNNIKLHQKLVSENIAISSVPKLFFRQIFPDANIVSVNLSPPIEVETFLVSGPQSNTPEALAITPLVQKYLNALNVSEE